MDKILDLVKQEKIFVFFLILVIPPLLPSTKYFCENSMKGL